MPRKVQTALISVSDKTGIVEFAQFLRQNGVKLISTGGTANALREAGLDVTDVSDLTNFPEMLDGRVKTLHPNVHGGILARRDNVEHNAALEEHGIAPIDMVVINLYPFEETVKNGADFDSCIENIDIGGPSMLRSAAKNHQDVAVVCDPDDYIAIQEEMQKNSSTLTPDTLRKLALKAFSRTATYDAAISQWFAKQESDTFPETLTLTATRKAILRYGENPHQQAALYNTNLDVNGITNAEQVQGKELSYNNIADTDAAYALVNEFEQPTAAIIKHANPCGIACANTLTEAYQKALACDPVSAYGGIFSFNQQVDEKTAELLSKLFAEVIIAPDVTPKAREILSRKKNLRLLLTGEKSPANQLEYIIKTVSGGLLLQQQDTKILDESSLNIVTKRQPSTEEMQDLIFAFTVCKHVKSNAIVLAKDHATIGIGAGQTSRVDSSRIAAWKAKETAENTKDASGSVLASDAFLPFADGLIAAADEGVTAIIQPGGSIRDEEVIAAADEQDMAMVFTNIRHFRH